MKTFVSFFHPGELWKKVHDKSNWTFKLEKIVSVKGDGRGEEKVVAEMVGLLCKIQESGGSVSSGMFRHVTMRRKHRQWRIFFFNQLLQWLVKPKGVAGSCEVGLGKYDILVPGAEAKGDWNSLFKCHFSLSITRLLLWTSGNKVTADPCPPPVVARTRTTTVTVVWRTFGRMKRFSLGDEPAITLRICWVMITMDLLTTTDMTGGFICQCINTSNVQ